MRSYALGPRCRAFVYQATLKRVLFPCRVDRVQLWAIGCHTRLAVFPFAPTCTPTVMRSLVGPIGVAIPLCWQFVTRYRLLFFVSSLPVVELAFLIASPSSDRHVNTGLVDDVVVVAPLRSRRRRSPLAPGRSSRFPLASGAPRPSQLPPDQQKDAKRMRKQGDAGQVGGSAEIRGGGGS